jgi:hypothetical protein
MSVYSIAVFLHILGALGIFAAIGLDWAGLSNLRRATQAAQVREWVRLLAAPRALGGPAALLVLVSGIYLSASRWGPQGWILMALAGMVVVGALGGAIGGRRIGAIMRALPAESGPVSITLRGHLDDPALTLSLRVRTALLLGIVFLMSTRPGWGGSLAAMGAALVLGVAAAMPGFGGSRRAAQVARGEG